MKFLTSGSCSESKYFCGGWGFCSAFRYKQNVGHVLYNKSVLFIHLHIYLLTEKGLFDYIVLVQMVMSGPSHKTPGSSKYISFYFIEMQQI